MAGPPASPPQVGVPISKAAIDAKIGSLSSSQRKTATGYQEMIDYLAPYTAADLLPLGYTQEEADLLLSCLRGPAEAPAAIAAYENATFLPRVGGI